MTYNAYEIAEQTGRPVEVYRFAIGSDTYDYTSAEDTVTVGGITYSPRAILRGSLRYGPEERGRPLGITLPTSDAFVVRYRLLPPGQLATLTLRRYHRDDGAAELALMFKGLVQAIRYGDQGSTSTLAVYTLEGRLATSIPRYTFSGVCSHFLYDSGCGVDENDPAFKFSSTITAASGLTITVSGASTFGDGAMFPAGFVRLPALGEQRSVISQASNVLTLMGPFPFDPTGLAVDCYAGCNHLVTGHCSTRFDNVPRFGGWPDVPKKNIFESGL